MGTGTQAHRHFFANPAQLYYVSALHWLIPSPTIDLKDAPEGIHEGVSVDD
jgi:hypothetical protein